MSTPSHSLGSHSLGETVVLAKLESLENRRCPRRVRQEVRDGIAVIAFSAAASCAIAVTLTILLALVG